MVKTKPKINSTHTTIQWNATKCQMHEWKSQNLTIELYSNRKIIKYPHYQSNDSNDVW